jgi:hypothetical protein
MLVPGLEERGKNYPGEKRIELDGVSFVISRMRLRLRGEEIDRLNLVQLVGGSRYFANEYPVQAGENQGITSKHILRTRQRLFSTLAA